MYDLKITASGVIFSLCFLISTILTEVYGYKLSVRSIWIMVICQTFYVVALNLSSIIQMDYNEISRRYYLMYHDFWRVMIGTWISVPVSYFINGIFISKMKMLFSGKLFFIRYTLGAVITQGALLLTAYPISLSGKYKFYELINIILTTWSYKVIISIVLLPLAIILAAFVKRIEKTDHFDWGESYNPILWLRKTKEG
ncbi:VUT family protein [Cedecea neteri]|uniref:VUT family protein n=1 Tax=Cedecea neteri TaxID=158822 RepID=UPI001FE9B6F8|nr:VUT family protein [Cedecea neteri]